MAAVTGCHRSPKQARSQPSPPPVTGSQQSRRTVHPLPRDSESSSGAGTPDNRPNAGGNSAHGGTEGSWGGKALSTEVGFASWYGPPYAGRKGADGTVYDQNAMTAAHLTLPLGATVRVTNLVSNQTVTVRVTDRGPFVRGRIIDLSLAAAKASGVYRAGVVKVRVDTLAIPPVRPDVLPGGRWCVQVGAFVTHEDALQEKADLAQRYPDAKVIEFAGPTGYWVRINPKVADKRHASDVAGSIHLPDAAQPYLTRTD